MRTLQRLFRSIFQRGPRNDFAAYASAPDTTSFQPTDDDALAVRDCLSARFMPAELVDAILDDAEYWPCI